MPLTISKSTWLNAIQCPTLAWYGLREPALPTKESDLFRMEQGQQVGALARELFPDGVWALRSEGQNSVEATQKLIADPETKTIFEARFAVGPFVARADMISRRTGSWEVLEVKSSFSDLKSEKLLYDLAYTVMVLRRSGLIVNQASLVLLSRQYRYGDGVSSLFEKVDKTNEVNSRCLEFEKIALAYSKALLADKPPNAKLVSLCGECPHFETKCLGAGIDRTVFELPNLHHTKFKQLAASGVVALAKIPADLKLSPRQERVKDAALTGKSFIDKELVTTLNAIGWPCHYLDFETVATVMPLYHGHGCHQQVLTQFSIHHRDSLHGDLRHSEYLADAAKDCQGDVAEALIDALGDRGAIFVYGSFEKTRINALRKTFPEFDGELQEIVDRLVDLKSVISNGIYHPEFRGSFSVKKVLPALVPQLSYKGLAIGDGNTAIARFARMAVGDLPADEVAKTRNELLEYCKLDTLAMVRLHEKLVELSKATLS